MKKKKMAFGGNVSDPLTGYFQQQYNKKINTPNYIQTPNETLARNDIAKAKAMSKSTNLFTDALDLFGTNALNLGTSMMQQGINSTQSPSVEGLSGMQFDAVSLPRVDDAQGFSLDMLQNLIPQFKAFGGKVNGMPVEVEGQEVAQTPDGNLINFQGPSHEQGGIQTQLPAGTDVYSKRIKDNGKTMAKKKLERENKANKLKKKYNDTKDNLVKNALDRTLQTNSIEDSFDLALQEQVQNQDFSIPQSNVKLANGITNLGGDDLDEVVIGNNNLRKSGFDFSGIGSILPENIPYSVLQSHIPQNIILAGQAPNSSTSFADTIQGYASKLPTVGDALGIFGNIKQAIDPYQNTLQNRAGDTPNINYYKDYGKKGLNTIDSMKNIASSIKDNQTKTLLNNQIVSNNNNRGNSRGINTMRAMDIATNNATLNALNDVNTNYSNQMLSILGQQASAENNQDSVVMGGEREADINNRQDRDSFYTQLGIDKQAIGEGITRTGKALNNIQERNVNNNFLNQIYDYVDGDFKTGRISAKPNTLVASDKTNNFNNTADTISPETYNNFLNPDTGKAFTQKQWTSYQQKMRDNPYLDSPAEIDTEYKTKVDPITKAAFKSNSDYQKFLSTGKTAENYTGQNLFSGNTFAKNLSKSNIDTAKSLLGNYLKDNNISNFNIDSKEDVKALQKKLGIKADGSFGDAVYKALKKLYK